MMRPMRFLGAPLLALSLLLVVPAEAQQREPLGAYPSGMPGGQVPLGAYPANRPPSVPSAPAGPGPLPPVQADDQAAYCLRNPVICNTRQPDAHDMSVERQRQFEERMRQLEHEIEQGRSTKAK